MVDANSKAGAKAVQAVEASLNQGNTDTLGPGVAGHTISGAAYRGKEVAANRGIPGPAEQGFGNSTGLGYAEPEEASALNDYERAAPTGQ